MTRQLRNYANDIATGHSWRDIAPESRVRRWFTLDELAWLATRVLAWACVGASVGYAVAIIAASV